jgi:poly-gamma-glutamate capsule biosynthesis protein CapA/YwtB (metallophosphatase superfamily)
MGVFGRVTPAQIPPIAPEVRNSYFKLIILFLLVSGCQSQPYVSPSIVSPSNQPASVTTTLVNLDTPTFTPAPVPTTPAPTAVYDPSPTLLPPTPTIAPPTALPTTTLLFTGIIVPARCVQAALDANGNPDYPYEEVRGIISGADLSIGTLNATMSDASPHTGCGLTYVLTGSPDNADAMARAGFDVMSVATNHIKNCNSNSCGNRAFFDTLANLQRVGILPVGAGKDLAEAMQPVVVTVNGIRFGFVSLGQIEPIAFAGEDSPGIAVLTPENLRSAIASARQVSDVVIAMPHWGPEDVPIPNWSQRELAQVAVEAGADLVVGNHTHVVQAMQEIDGVKVFYGLGNFVFDQGLRDHRQGIILKVTFQGTRLVGYELIPTHVDRDGRVHLAGAQEATEILQRIDQISQAIK